MTDTITELWIVVWTVLGLSGPAPQPPVVITPPIVAELPDPPAPSHDLDETPATPAETLPVRCRLDRGGDGKTLVAWASSDLGWSGTYSLLVTGSSLKMNPKGRVKVAKGETTKLVTTSVATGRSVSAVLTLKWEGGETSCTPA
jgi:hypothetical protein